MTSLAELSTRCRPCLCLCAEVENGEIFANEKVTETQHPLEGKRVEVVDPVV
jgi:hypothetical protein